MSHPYNAAHDCQCARCIKERARRALQARGDARAKRTDQLTRQARARHASREEQHARYIDCGPGAWDDNGYGGGP